MVCARVPFAANVDPSRRYLYLQVLGGKAFLEHLQEPESLPGQVTSALTLHVNFRGTEVQVPANALRMRT